MVPREWTEEELEEGRDVTEDPVTRIESMVRKFVGVSYNIDKDGIGWLYHRLIYYKSQISRLFLWYTYTF